MLTLVSGGSGGLEAGCDLVEKVDWEVFLQVQSSAVYPQRGHVLVVLVHLWEHSQRFSEPKCASQM